MTKQQLKTMLDRNRIRAQDREAFEKFVKAVGNRLVSADYQACLYDVVSTLGRTCSA